MKVEPQLTVDKRLPGIVEALEPQAMFNKQQQGLFLSVIKTHHHHETGGEQEDVHEPSSIFHRVAHHFADSPFERSHAAIHKELALWKDMEPLATLHLPSSHIHDGLLHSTASVDR